MLNRGLFPLSSGLRMRAIRIGIRDWVEAKRQAIMFVSSLSVTATTMSALVISARFSTSGLLPLPTTVCTSSVSADLPEPLLVPVDDDGVDPLVGEDVGDMVSDLAGPDDDHFHFGITIDFSAE